jgi:integrase
VIDPAGTWLAHPLPGRKLRSEHVEFDADHMLERFRLFLIIALGESVLSSGTALADASSTLLTVVTGTCGLVTIVALWKLHFASSGRLMDSYVETTTDPILAARRTVNGLLVSVAGLIAAAVGNELVIAHPHGQASMALSLVLCIRWYPRLELPRGPDGSRRFESLGGYPTRSQAEAALADALARRSRGLALDPAKLTVDQYLDRWLDHIRLSLRARTVARYTALLRDHVRPHVGARPLKQLTALEIQAIYDRLAVGGRRDGKPGGLAPQHILAVHRCLHRALAQAVTWRLVARNVATHATPPPVPPTEVVTLAPQQVALLLDAAGRAPSPWLGSWTVLAAATDARNGELCALEWADLDLDAGTVRFRQALTIIDPAVLPDPDPGGRRKELAVGPVKSAASSAILALPPFAVQALRQHRRQQARLRLACGQPQTIPLRRVEPGRPPQPVQLDLVFRTQRGTPVNPNHASRAFARLAASVELVAHPHLLRHALASAMAANKEPASIIAAQLRHADGGALAQRVYIHQLPQTAPRLAGVIEGVFGPAARNGRMVSATRRAEGNRSETGASNPT